MSRVIELCRLGKVSHLLGPQFPNLSIEPELDDIKFFSGIMYCNSSI